MIHRTYIVLCPTGEGPGPIDIIVEGPVGFSTVNGLVVPTPPGQKPTIAVKSTNAPVGWLGTGGAYYELLAKTLRIEQRALINGSANPAFTPRFRLGWNLSVQTLASADSLPVVSLSQSLVNNLGTADSAIVIATLADPAYGPVIRIQPASLGGQTLAVHLSVYGQEDEDGFMRGN